MRKSIRKSIDKEKSPWMRSKGYIVPNSGKACGSDIILNICSSLVYISLCGLSLSTAWAWDCAEYTNSNKKKCTRMQKMVQKNVHKDRFQNISGTITSIILGSAGKWRHFLQWVNEIVKQDNTLPGTTVIKRSQLLIALPNVCFHNMFATKSAIRKPAVIQKSVAICRHKNENSRQLSMSWELLPALCCRKRNLSRSVERSLLLSVDISQVNSHSKRGWSGETTRQRLQRNISPLPVLNSETWRTMRTEMMDEISGFMSEASSGKANICFVLQLMTESISMWESVKAQMP